MIRSRVKWFKECEKNTKHFLNLEKIGVDRKRISKIKNEQGNNVNEQTHILAVLKLYFEKFYQSVTSSMLR